MKKWKDVSIRVKVLIPIVLMLVMMSGYLLGTLFGFGQMHQAVVTLAEKNISCQICDIPTVFTDFPCRYENIMPVFRQNFYQMGAHCAGSSQN